RRAGRGRAALRARLPYRGGADRPCPRATRAARTFLRQSYCDRAAGRLRSLRAPCAVTTQIRHSRVRRGSWGKPMRGPFWRNEPNPHVIPDFGERNPTPKSGLVHFGETNPTADVTVLFHPTGREGERSELKRAFCSSLSEL